MSLWKKKPKKDPRPLAEQMGEASDALHKVAEELAAKTKAEIAKNLDDIEKKKAKKKR